MSRAPEVPNYTLISGLWDGLRELVGTELMLVDYYHDDRTSFKTFEGVCDCCRYGIAIETSSGWRYRIWVRHFWNDGLREA